VCAARRIGEIRIIHLFCNTFLFVFDHQIAEISYTWTITSYK